MSINSEANDFYSFKIDKKKKKKNDVKRKNVFLLTVTM